MAMRSPRMRRISVSLRPSRSTPSNRIRPEVTPTDAGSKRIVESAVMLLPDPDSPTTPTTSPSPIENETPSRIVRPPTLVLRPSISSTGFGAISATLELEARIEHVAQPVTHQVHAEHRDGDDQARKQRDPGRSEEHTSEL